MKKKCACPNIENSSKKNVPFKPCGNGCVFQGMHMREIVVFPKRCMCSPREWWCSSRKCLCSSRRCVCFTKNGCVLQGDAYVFQGNDCVLQRDVCGPHGSKFLCSSQGGMVMFLGKCLRSLRNAFPKNKCIDSLRKWYKCS